MATGHAEQSPSDEVQVAENRAIDARIAETAATVRMAPTQGTYMVLDDHGRVVERRGEID